MAAVEALDAAEAKYAEDQLRRREEEQGVVYDAKEYEMLLVTAAVTKRGRRKAAPANRKRKRAGGPTVAMDAPGYKLRFNNDALPFVLHQLLAQDDDAAESAPLLLCVSCKGVACCSCMWQTLRGSRN